MASDPDRPLSKEEIRWNILGKISPFPPKKEVVRNIRETIDFVFALYGNPATITEDQWLKGAKVPDDRILH